MLADRNKCLFKMAIVNEIVKLCPQEYVLPDVKDRQHLLTLHKKAKKIGLDINHYNTLKDEVSYYIMSNILYVYK